MSKYEKKFRLWKNRRKEKPTHHDLVGDIVIDGRSYWLGAWINENDDGTKTIRGSIGKEKAPQQTTYEKEYQEAAQPVKSFAEDMDDDLPF